MATLIRLIQKTKQENMADNRIDYTQWLKRGTSTYIPTDNAKTVTSLEAGVYNIRWAQELGYYVFKKDLKLDELVILPMPESEEVLESIKSFWTKKQIFKDYGVTFKRLLLLYGVPGGVKTSIINLVCKHLIDTMNGIVFVLSNETELNHYQEFMPQIYRVIEPERPIITIIEDIDGLCARHSSETQLINILDGIEQLENVVYIATTNYTEKLNERILNRPNRFDRRIEVKSPNRECRRIYFRSKLTKEDLKKINMKEWCDATEGLTMASLGEVVKSVIILGHPLKETIEILRNMKQVPTSRKYNEGSGGSGIGFSNSTPSYSDDPVEEEESISGSRSVEYDAPSEAPIAYSSKDKLTEVERKSLSDEMDECKKQKRAAVIKQKYDEAAVWRQKESDIAKILSEDDNK